MQQWILRYLQHESKSIPHQDEFCLADRNDFERLPNYLCHINIENRNTISEAEIANMTVSCTAYPINTRCAFSEHSLIFDST